MARIPRCENPACGKPLAERGEKVRKGRRYCGSPCRAERARLAKQGITTRAAAKAFLSAQGQSGGGPGMRADTVYMIWELGPNRLTMIFVGMASAHSREQAVEFVRSGALGGDESRQLVPVPMRSMKPL